MAQSLASFRSNSAESTRCQRWGCSMASPQPVSSQSPHPTLAIPMPLPCSLRKSHSQTFTAARQAGQMAGQTRSKATGSGRDSSKL